MTHDELMAALDAYREQSKAAIAPLDANALVYADGGWLLKDVITHVTAWEETVVDTVNAQRRGETPVAVIEDEGPALHAFNDAAYQSRKHLAYAEVLAQWDGTRSALKEAVAALSADDLAAEVTTPWGERGPLIAMVRGIMGHERHHINEIVERVGQPA